MLPTAPRSHLPLAAGTVDFTAMKLLRTYQHFLMPLYLRVVCEIDQ